MSECLFDINKCNYKQFQCIGNGALLTIDNYTLGVLWDSRCFFIFDSHCRDNEGRKSPNGTAILLKFHNLAMLEEYIKTIYYGDTQESSMYFQIQFIELRCHENSIRAVKCELKRERKAQKNKETYAKNRIQRQNEAKRRYNENPMGQLERQKQKYEENPAPQRKCVRQCFAEDPLCKKRL